MAFTVTPTTKVKLDDFGEKIGGARKDLKGRIIPADIEGKAVEEAVIMARRDYIWPVPDFEAIREEMIKAGGLKDDEPDQVVRALKMVRDAIPPAPSQTRGEEGRLRYVAAIAALRDALTPVRSVAGFIRAWEDERVREFACLAVISPVQTSTARRFVSTFSMRDIGTPYKRTALYGSRSLFSAIEASLTGRVPSSSVLGVVLKTSPQWPAVTDQVERLISRHWLEVDWVPGDAGGGRWGILYRGSAVKDEEQLKNASYGLPDVVLPVLRLGIANGWESKIEATKALREPFATLLAAKTEQNRSERKAELSVLLRNGGGGTAKDWRADRCAVPDDYCGPGSLRMRAGEFGNWVDASKRQELLDAGYDGFRDLADVVGITPDAVSLNGTLAVAFGARGSGPFAGHYEPGRRVINLTKPTGIGVLAHEWAHALDHWAALQVMKSNKLQFLHLKDWSRPFLSNVVAGLVTPPSVALGDWRSQHLTSDERGLIELADAMFHMRFKNVMPATPEAYEAWMADKRAAAKTMLENYLGPLENDEPAESFVWDLARTGREVLMGKQDLKERRQGQRVISYDAATLARTELSEKIIKDLQPSCLAMAKDLKAMVKAGVSSDKLMIRDGVVNKLRRLHWGALPISQVFTRVSGHVDYYAHRINEVISYEEHWRTYSKLPAPSYKRNEFTVALGKITEYYQRPHEAFARSVETAVAKTLKGQSRQSGFLVPLGVANGGKGHPDGEVADRFTEAFLAVMPKLPLQAPVIISEGGEEKEYVAGASHAERSASEPSWEDGVIEAVQNVVPNPTDWESSTPAVDEGKTDALPEPEAEEDSAGLVADATAKAEDERVAETIAGWDRRLRGVGEPAPEAVIEPAISPVAQPADVLAVEEPWASRPLAAVPEWVEVPETDREAMQRVDEYSRKGHLAVPARVTRQQWIEDFLGLGFVGVEERKAGKAPMRLRLSHPTKADANGRALFYEVQHPAEMRYVRARLAQIVADTGCGNEVALPVAAAGAVKAKAGG